MKRARIASLAPTLDQAPDERRAIVEWPSTPDGKPVAGCVVSATRASDGTPMLDVMDCDPATRVRVVWDNLARMSISDAMCDRALAAMGYRPAYPNEHARDAQRKTMRAAIEAAIYGEAQGLSAAHALAAAGEIVDNAPVVYRCVCGHFKEEHTVEGGCAGCDNGGVASDAEIMHTYRADRGAPVYASEPSTAVTIVLHLGEPVDDDIVTRVDRLLDVGTIRDAFSDAGITVRSVNPTARGDLAALLMEAVDLVTAATEGTTVRWLNAREAFFDQLTDLGIIGDGT